MQSLHHFYSLAAMRSTMPVRPLLSLSLPQAQRSFVCKWGMNNGGGRPVSFCIRIAVPLLRFIERASTFLVMAMKYGEHVVRRMNAYQCPFKSHQKVTLLCSWLRDVYDTWKAVLCHRIKSTTWFVHRSLRWLNTM